MKHDLIRLVPIAAAVWVVIVNSRRCRNRLLTELAENRRRSSEHADRILREQPDAEAIAAWAVVEVERGRPQPAGASVRRLR